MIRKGLPIICIGLLLAASCTPQTGSNNKENYTPPAPGTTVTKGSTVTDDELNHFTFSVFVKAGDASNKGIYDVVAVYGHDTASGQFTMPRGAEQVRPLIRKADDPSAFIIGFRYGSDTTFNDYYEVSGARGTIAMRYVKAYSFE